MAETALDKDIETIESGYEFLLAFAAQGRPAQVETGPGPHARPTIEGMLAAMNSLIKAFSNSETPFELVIADDCCKAAAAIGFILAQEKIGSEIVDNLNASIHLRAVLTDLFLYGEALKPLGDQAN
ncbi:MAG: hypothetical protein COC19_03580 [SAR86 cluster bacterium]|uniref:Uncharacterized protein n=1 Tax=SAR86 cluster bacterium TaxID=2030880 RepID=A0A2A4MQ51_9GAMM|nr:MAG: hypothetical protein COC19_03580 [SAR86 cluster bacterium]